MILLEWKSFLDLGNFIWNFEIFTDFSIEISVFWGIFHDFSFLYQKCKSFHVKIIKNSFEFYVKLSFFFSFFGQKLLFFLQIFHRFPPFSATFPHFLTKFDTELIMADGTDSRCFCDDLDSRVWLCDRSWKIKNWGFFLLKFCEKLLWFSAFFTKNHEKKTQFLARKSIFWRKSNEKLCVFRHFNKFFKKIEFFEIYRLFSRFFALNYRFSELFFCSFLKIQFQRKNCIFLRKYWKKINFLAKIQRKVVFFYNFCLIFFKIKICFFFSLKFLWNFFLFKSRKNSKKRNFLEKKDFFAVFCLNYWFSELFFLQFFENLI